MQEAQEKKGERRTKRKQKEKKKKPLLVLSRRIVSPCVDTVLRGDFPRLKSAETTQDYREEEKKDVRLDGGAKRMKCHQSKRS